MIGRNFPPVSSRLTPRLGRFRGVLANFIFISGVDLGMFLSPTEAYDWSEFLTEPYDWSEFPMEACDWSEFSKNLDYVRSRVRHLKAPPPSVT